MRGIGAIQQLAINPFFVPLARFVHWLAWEEEGGMGVVILGTLSSCLGSLSLAYAW
jgi:hypothetical protein